ncbi:MAG TPA: hypothetical protein VFD92_06855 [Candidatus Binatia bacterium]|nr:hypothetical protein [Candidatus Binatia bacterium]
MSEYDNQYHIHGPRARTLVEHYLNLHQEPHTPQLVDLLSHKAIEGLVDAHVANINASAVLCAASVVVLAYINSKPAAPVLSAAQLSTIKTIADAGN